MKNILVPIDFSEVSMDALRVAAQLALRANAGLSLLHVNEMLPYMAVVEYAYTPSAYDLEQYGRESYERLQNMVADLLSEPAFSKLNIRTTVQTGLMIPVIEALTTDKKVDLMVVGTMGATGWKEVLMGSNTERIIRNAHCPVLVIPKGVQELQVKKVLVPTTLQSDQLEVFNIVKVWQDLLGFEVETLYLNDPLHVSKYRPAETEKEVLTGLADLKNVPLHRHVHIVDEEGAIQAYAEKLETDLIIMGTHQRRGISHLLFNSITEDTANHSHIPVLAVPIG